MATPFSILACRIAWTEEPGRVHGVAKSQTLLSGIASEFLEMPSYNTLRPQANVSFIKGHEVITELSLASLDAFS